MNDLINRKFLIKDVEESQRYNPHRGNIEKQIHNHEHRHFLCMINNQPEVEAFPKSYVDQIRWERDIALEQLKEIGCEFGMKMDEIKKKLESSSDWIPIDERLPEEKGWYQCTCSDDEVWSKPIVRDLYYYPGLKAFADNIRYEMNGLNDIQKFNWTKYVTAWKILPEAYKGD